MVRKPTQASRSALIAIILSVLAATSASAADVVGKWYGKLDASPVIIIDKTGSKYSASLVDIDSTRDIGGGIGVWHQRAIHKSLVSFGVVGGNVQFSIRNMISVGGDTNYERDEYNLNLSDDGQLTGTVRRTLYNEGPDQPRTGIGPITLFPSDWTSRAANLQP